MPPSLHRMSRMTHPFGESLGERSPEELSDEDCATTIMARPIPKEPKVFTKPKKENTQVPNEKSVRAERDPVASSTQSLLNNLPIDQSTNVVSSSKIESPAPLKTPQQFSDLQDLFGSPIPLRATIPTINAQKYKISLGLVVGVLNRFVHQRLLSLSWYRFCCSIDCYRLE